jgi:hypothetical protein
VFQKTLKNRQQDSSSGKRSLIVGSLIATVIAATPFLFYLYEGVPETKTWNTFLFTFESNFYDNANQAMWLITTKTIPLLILLIWFFTCKHWWYHVILVPIAMYAYQLSSFISLDTANFDGFSFVYFIPIMAIIIPSVYLIRAQMFNKLNDAGKTMEELEDEFKIKPKTFLGKFSDYF